MPDSALHCLCSFSEGVCHWVSYRSFFVILNRLPVHAQFLGWVGLHPQAFLFLAVGHEGRAGVLRGVALGRFLLCECQPIRPQGVVIPA